MTTGKNYKSSMKEAKQRLIYLYLPSLEKRDELKILAEKAKIILENRKSIKYRKDSLDITNELTQEISKRYFSARKGIFELHNYLIERQKSGEIPKSNIA